MEPELPKIRVRTRKSLIRWFVAGLLFMGVNTLVLYFLVRWLSVTVMLATLVSAEICTLLRFVLNERWVFGLQKQSWTRLGQYHVANGGAFIVWWLGTNALTHFGVNYLLASIVAVALSTGLSFTSNFYWVWRTKKQPTI
jgi:putative flippase GtrA